MTPAVLLAAVFATACAGLSIAFVAAHGGLEVPTAASASNAVAVASPSANGPSSGPAGSAVASASAPAPVETPAATSSGPAGPTPTPGITTPAPSLDPLAILAGCPDHPGCYLYTVRRGDTLGAISDRWAIGLWIVEALNPEIRDPSTIVPGQTVYLGRSPVVRLDRCPDTSGCYLYVVRSGDRLSTIAGRYGTTTSAILAMNPQITDPNAIHTGETIRLPGP